MRNWYIWVCTDIMLPNKMSEMVSSNLMFFSVCLCACLPQTAPQTWITILRRTMTATRQSRKPVMMQFMARSVPENLQQQMNLQHPVKLNTYRKFMNKNLIELNEIRVCLLCWICCCIVTYTSNYGFIHEKRMSVVDLIRSRFRLFFYMINCLLYLALLYACRKLEALKCRDFRYFIYHMFFRIFMTKTTRSGSRRNPGGKWSEPPPWPELVASFSTAWSFMPANHWLGE